MRDALEECEEDLGGVLMSPRSWPASSRRFLGEGGGREYIDPLLSAFSAATTPA